MTLAIKDPNYQTREDYPKVAIKLEGNSSSGYQSSREVSVSLENLNAWERKAKEQEKEKKLSTFQTFFCFEPKTGYEFRSLKFGIRNGMIDSFKELIRGLNDEIAEPKKQITQAELRFGGRLSNLFECERMQ